jgi:LytTr DNA-binding domain
MSIMNEYQPIPGNRIEFDHAIQTNPAYESLHSLNNQEVKAGPKIIQLPDTGEIKSNSDNFLFNGRKKNIKKENSVLLLRNKAETNTSPLPYQNAPNLFRLFVKNGEYVYARPNDIIMMESCDHLVKVYVALNDKIKKTIRHDSLKDFLLQLPQDQFIRIGRFCAVNINRLSGGNCNEQTFEFDFRVSIKLKHAISHSAFYAIGK